MSTFRKSIIKDKVRVESEIENLKKISFNIKKSKFEIFKIVHDCFKIKKNRSASNHSKDKSRKQVKETEVSNNEIRNGVKTLPNIKNLRKKTLSQNIIQGERKDTERILGKIEENGKIYFKIQKFLKD